MGKNFLIEFFKPDSQAKTGTTNKGENSPTWLSSSLCLFASNPFLPLPCSSVLCLGADSINYISQASLGSGFPLVLASGRLLWEKPRHLSSSLSVTSSSSGRGFVSTMIAVCTGQPWLLGSADTTSSVCSSSSEVTMASCSS